MATDRINTRLPAPRAEHVARVVGPEGLYETPSEYIRDLIRRDMDLADLNKVRDSVVEGYRDLAEGRYFLSTGNFHKDQAIYKEREAKGWQ